MPPTPPSGMSNEPSGSEYTQSYSSSGDVVDVQPAVNAMIGTPEHERQMEELHGWRISRRHGRCVMCLRDRDPTGWNGCCRWCGGHICSEACLVRHDEECEEGVPRGGGSRDPTGQVHASLHTIDCRDTPVPFSRSLSRWRWRGC